VGRIFNTHEDDKNAYKIFVGNLNGGDHLRILGVNGAVMSKNTIM
jgi:hypothetical protein